MINGCPAFVSAAISKIPLIINNLAIGIVGLAGIKILPSVGLHQMRVPLQKKLSVLDWGLLATAN